MFALLLALQGPLAVAPDTVHLRHDALAHDITIVVGDTGSHILGLVQTTWRLGSADPVEVPLDSTFRVVRVLTDGEGEPRMGRITFALNRDGGVYIPHHRQAGDTLHTSIRYHGAPRDGLIFHADSSGRRTVFADNWPDRAHGWLPIPDHPSDKVAVDLHIEVPPGMSVIANGTSGRWTPCRAAARSGTSAWRRRSRPMASSSERGRWSGPRCPMPPATFAVCRWR
jgi:hypothetical protein